MRISSLTTAVLALTAVLPLAVHAQGHHGMTGIPATSASHQVGTDVEIVGLGEDEIADLRSGQGAGQARVADAQGYPGPRHVLDAAGAGALALSPSQAQRVQEIYRAMASEARRLGALVLDAEQDLARAFREGDIDAASLQARVERIAALRGELRAMHLRAHLETRSVLDATQIARYMTLRGQAPNGESPPSPR